jgi:hypothetical protein
MTALMALLAIALSPACGGCNPCNPPEPPPPEDLCIKTKSTPTLFTRELGLPITDAGVNNEWGAKARYLGAQPVGQYKGQSDRVLIEWGDGFYKSHIFTGQYQEIQGGGQHTVFEIQVDPRKKLDPFTIEFDASVKSYSGSDDAVGQLVFFMYLINKVTGRNQVNLFAMFDNRFDYYVPFIGNDTYTDFDSAPMQVHFPQTMEMNPYPSKKYVLDFTKQKMQDFGWTDDYELVLIGFLHEVFITPTNSNVDMAVEVSGIKVTCK